MPQWCRTFWVVGLCCSRPYKAVDSWLDRNSVTAVSLVSCTATASSLCPRDCAQHSLQLGIYFNFVHPIALSVMMCVPCQHRLACMASGDGHRPACCPCSRVHSLPTWTDPYSPCRNGIVCRPGKSIIHMLVRQVNADGLHLSGFM